MAITIQGSNGSATISGGGGTVNGMSNVTIEGGNNVTISTDSNAGKIGISVDVPTNLGQLNNDCGYATTDEVAQAIQSSVLASWNKSY